MYSSRIEACEYNRDPLWLYEKKKGFRLHKGVMVVTMAANLLFRIPSISYERRCCPWTSKLMLYDHCTLVYSVLNSWER